MSDKVLERFRVKRIRSKPGFATKPTRRYVLTLAVSAFYCLVAGRGEITFIARCKTNNDFIMSELKKASDRLEQAIERLDQALANDRPSARDSHAAALASTVTAVERERDSLRADVDALKLERAQLAQALADARERQAATRQANEAVAERLDDAIGSLRVILGV